MLTAAGGVGVPGSRTRRAEETKGRSTEPRLRAPRGPGQRKARSAWPNHPSPGWALRTPLRPSAASRRVLSPSRASLSRWATRLLGPAWELCLARGLHCRPGREASAALGGRRSHLSARLSRQARQGTWTRTGASEVLAARKTIGGCGAQVEQH